MAYLRSVDMPLFLNLVFSVTTWFWLLGCLILGAGYAILLYSKRSSLSKVQQKILFGLRTLTVAGIAFLLFAPLIKITHRRLEKPLIVIAQDNSASINISRSKNFNPSVYSKRVKALERKLRKDFAVKTFEFGNKISSPIGFAFKDNLTDISALFRQINEQYANRNIGSIILASDGIYNHGGNPQFEAAKINTPIYTVALGDTIPKKDLLIANVRYNDIVFLDNQFQIEVEINGYLSKGVESKLTVSDKTGVKAIKNVNIGSNDYHATVPIILNARLKGIQSYTLNLSPASGEISKRNNSKKIFINVIDGRQKILLIANSPHPDITAFKQGIEENKNYEVKVVMADNVRPTDISEADLLFLHQLPSIGNNAQSILKQAVKKPLMFILGAQSDVSLFSVSQNVLDIKSTGSIQETLGSINPDFYGFTLSESSRNQISTFAPLLSPFGNYSLKGDAGVLLFQKIGKVTTDKPLLLFSLDQHRRIGILTGEGIWRWKLNDFEQNGNHLAVNDLISKMIQFLASKEDKRKFRVYTNKNVFEENEQVLFNAELYNDAYELVNTPDVKMQVKNKKGKAYSFLFSKTGNSYELNAGTLPPGEYDFTANTNLGNKEYSFRGQFNVIPQETEFVQTRANHQLLFSLAKESNGKMVSPDSVETLVNLLKNNEMVKSVSYEDKEYEELINVKLVFFFLLILLSIEWVSRKRSGEI